MQGVLGAMLPMLMIFGIFYVILLRPQMKKQREHQAMLAKLGKGDKVLTRGGLIGLITGVTDNGIVVLELQEKVRVRMPRAFIEAKWDDAAPEAAEKNAA